MEISSQHVLRRAGAVLSVATALACGSGNSPVTAQGGAPPQGVSESGSPGQAGNSMVNPPQGGAENGGASHLGGMAGSVSGGAGGAAGATAGETGAGGSSGSAGAAGAAAGAAGASGAAGSGTYEPISFGTKLDPVLQVQESQSLAKTLVDPSAASYRAKGDQHRTYRFAEAGADVPYRLCVPSDWDGTSPLPLVMFLHGAGNDESSYLDQNGKQMVKLAGEHGYLLVSPLGYGGAYGNFLRLNAGFSAPEEAAKLLAKRTPEDEKKQQVSEKDVINVLELVLHEYPIERSRMFLTGHSMGSGGTWYIGGKYASYWAALAPMSGPFVLERGYPWEALRGKPILVTEGLSAASLSDSRGLRDWLMASGFAVSYEEVQADHPGMVPLVLPRVFSFFDGVK